MSLPPTPSQTIGPFFAVGLIWADGPEVVPDAPVETNATDPLLSSIRSPEVRARLVAVADAGGLRFDIRLQGGQETPFLAI